jgi:hypothetical protein
MATEIEKKLAITILKERLEHTTGKKVLFVEANQTIIDGVKIVKDKDGHLEFYIPTRMTDFDLTRWKKDNKDAIDKFRFEKIESDKKDELLTEGFWDTVKSKISGFVPLTLQNVIAENTKLLKQIGKLIVDKAGKLTWTDPNAAKALAWMLNPDDPKLKDYIVATNINKTPVFEYKKSPDGRTFIWRKINWSSSMYGGHGEGLTGVTGVTITRDGQVIDEKNPEYKTILQKVGLGGGKEEKIVS